MTEGFLVEELEERGRLEIRFSGADGTTGVNEVFTVSFPRLGVSLVGYYQGYDNATKRLEPLCLIDSRGRT